MFDIGWQELFIVAILAIIVVGPKDLPRVLKTVMGLVRKGKGMAREFQSGVDEMVREADLDDLKKEAQSLKSMDFAKEMENTIDPTGDISKSIGMDGVREELESIKSGASEDAHSETDVVAKSLADLESEAEAGSQPSPEAVETVETVEVATPSDPSELSEEMLTSSKKS